MIKGIIFDLDGTLLNTLVDLKNAVNYALKTNNLQEITLKQTRDYVGNGVKMLITRAIGENSNPKLIDDTLKLFTNYYDLHQNDYTIPYDGIIETIKELKKLGLKMAIVSNKYQQGVDNLCRPLFKDYIGVFIGAQDNIKLKPAPDMVNIALDKLGLKNNECYFVGDSNVDALTGKNANMEVIGVTWGYKDKEVLEALKVDYLIDKPQEIIKIVTRANKTS